MSNRIKIALSVLLRIELVCLVVPMVVLILLIFIQIIMRTMMLPGFSWLEELSRYVFVFCTFLGASIAIDTHSHPRMTALIVAVPRQASLAIKIAGNVFFASGSRRICSSGRDIPSSSI